MVVLLATGVFCAAIHTFAGVCGKQLATETVKRLMEQALHGAIRPSRVFHELGLDWSKFLDHVKGPIRRELEKLERSYDGHLFAVDFRPAAEIGSSTSGVDVIDTATLDEAKAAVLHRCPGAVFAEEWRPMIDGPNPTWSHSFLNAYADSAAMAADPAGVRPFASILNRGDDAPASDARLKASR